MVQMWTLSVRFWLGFKDTAQPVYWGFITVQLKPLKNVPFTQIVWLEKKESISSSTFSVMQPWKPPTEISTCTKGNFVLTVHFKHPRGNYLSIIISIPMTPNKPQSLQWTVFIWITFYQLNSSYDCWQCSWWITQLIGDTVSRKSCCC